MFSFGSSWKRFQRVNNRRQRKGKIQLFWLSKRISHCCFLHYVMMGVLYFSFKNKIVKQSYIYGSSKFLKLTISINLTNLLQCRPKAYWSPCRGWYISYVYLEYDFEQKGNYNICIYVYHSYDQLFQLNILKDHPSVLLIYWASETIICTCGCNCYNMPKLIITLGTKEKE